MIEWNVVVSIHERSFRKAVTELNKLGEVRKTDFFNVLVLKVDNIPLMLETLREQLLTNPESLSFLSKLIPVTHTFMFHSVEEFEDKAKEIVKEWIPQLAEKRFYVRIHRRGFKGRFFSPEEERFLDTFILKTLDQTGKSASIAFTNPDTVIAVETIGLRAGLSIWTREELDRYPFIRLD